MSIGRRYELLMAVASRSIPKPRREELMVRMLEWLQGPMKDATVEELFYVLGAEVAIGMGRYTEVVQAQIGTRILEESVRRP